MYFWTSTRTPHYLFFGPQHTDVSHSSAEEQGILDPKAPDYVTLRGATAAVDEEKANSGQEATDGEKVPALSTERDASEKK